MNPTPRRGDFTDFILAILHQLEKEVVLNSFPGLAELPSLPNASGLVSFLCVHLLNSPSKIHFHTVPHCLIRRLPYKPAYASKREQNGDTLNEYGIW
jgi:hypothetical protein